MTALMWHFNASISTSTRRSRDDRIDVPLQRIDLDIDASILR
jgi:hypothetical protein